MKTSESITELATALTKAQSEWPAIEKSAKSYNNKYAPLDKIIELVRPVLAKHGLSFVQMPGQAEHINQIVLTSRLMHSSGQYIEETATFPVPQLGKANDAQNYGAGLTYGRRYSIEAMLGIAATEDTDAANQNGQQTQRQVQNEPPPPKENGQKLTPFEMKLYRNDAGAFNEIHVHIPRYKHENAVKNAAKLLGYTSWPKGNDNAMLRVIIFRELSDYARMRDEGMDKEAAIDWIRNADKAEQEPLFETTNGAYVEVD